METGVSPREFFLPSKSTRASFKNLVKARIMKKSSLVLISLFLFLSFEALAVQYIDVVLIRTADDDGSNTSTVTSDRFKQLIAYANKAYGPDIVFRFDPVSGFPAVINSTLLNRDFELARGETLNQPEDQKPRVVSTKYTTARNEYLMKNFPGKMVALAHRGSVLKFNKTSQVWEDLYYDGAWGNSVDSYMKLVYFDDGRDGIFAHEGGHFLQLHHTFNDWLQPKDLAGFQKIVNDHMKNGGKPGDVVSIFQGDEFTDTLPDPGPELFHTLTGHYCDAAPATITVNYNWGPYAKTADFTPQRNNPLNYFFCNNMDPVLTASQKKRALTAVTVGNRSFLTLKNPGISIPRHSFNFAMTSWGPGRVDVVTDGADLQLRHMARVEKNWDPGIDAGWWSHGGESVGTPVIASLGNNLLTIIRRDRNGHIWNQEWTGSGWSPSLTDWYDLGGNFAGDVHAVSWAPGRLDLFVRGWDGNVYHKAYENGWWPSQTGWINLGGGGVTSDPVAVAWDKNRLDIFVRGKNGDVIHKAWTGSSWWPAGTDWESLGGVIPFGSKPAVASVKNNRLSVLVRGMDNAAWYNFWNGQTWSGWNSIGGSMTSDPSIANYNWGVPNVFLAFRGADGKVNHRVGNGENVWINGDSWKTFPVKVLPGTRVNLIGDKDGNVHMMVRDTNFDIQYKGLLKNDWYPAGNAFEYVGKSID